MRVLSLVFLVPFFLGGCGLERPPRQTNLKPLPAKAECPAGENFTIAMHGGAGVITKDKMTDEMEADYRDTLQRALAYGGNDLLAKGFSALDTVELVVITLEDDPKFNAGKGAVFNADGINELDASIMDGRDRNAGSVAGVSFVKNPIRLAREVMDNSRHVMLQGDGAEIFAFDQGIETTELDWFHTDRRWQQLQDKLNSQHGDYKPFTGEPETRFGTVGVVVKDNCGNLAAGTSTGGLTAKRWGRVGDTPIIGAGTYADNHYCAVSATGTGEYFIRATVARDICARREFTGETIQEAADHLIHKTLIEIGGDGGVVAIDNDGDYAFSFNTPGMYRGGYKGGHDIQVEIFGAKE